MKIQRIIMNGPKGSILIEKKLDLQAKLAVAVEDRDRYEGYFN